VTGENRPIPAGCEWPLYGDEYDRIKFGNVPTDGQCKAGWSGYVGLWTEMKVSLSYPIVLSNVWLLGSSGSLANAEACFLTLDKRVHFV